MRSFINRLLLHLKCLFHGHEFHFTFPLYYLERDKIFIKSVCQSCGKETLKRDVTPYIKRSSKSRSSR